MVQAWELLLQARQQPDATFTLGHIRRMNQYFEQQAVRVHHHMPFASFYPLPAIKTAQPPFSVVLTDWLSMMVALGVGSRPICTRSRSRKTVLICSHKLLRRPCRKYQKTVEDGGNSGGNKLQAHPVCSTYTIAFTISRRGHL